MKKHFTVPATALLMLFGFCCGAAEGTVSASWLNARIFPDIKSPAAVKLPRGKKVEIFKRHGVWLEIGAPDITPVYAAAAFINGNTVSRDINLRVRPDLKAAVIFRVKKGTQLKAVTEPDRFGWVQVAPMADMRLYVMRDYVIFDAAQVPVAAMPQKDAPAEKPAAAPEKKEAPAPEKKEAPAPAPVKKEAPAEKPAAAPEKKEAPAPVKKETAAPEKKEAPAAKPAAAPDKKEAPAPVKKETAAPEKKEAPAEKPAAAPEKKEAPAEKPAAAPEKKDAPAVKETPAPEKKEVSAFELLPLRKRELLNIGTDITKYSEFKKSGRLVAVLNPSGDCTTYALVDPADNRSLGFIFAEAPIDLKTMVDKKVAVKGFAYKVSGWRNPVVCAVEVKTIGE